MGESWCRKSGGDNSYSLLEERQVKSAHREIGCGKRSQGRKGRTRGRRSWERGESRTDEPVEQNESRGESTI